MPQGRKIAVKYIITENENGKPIRDVLRYDLGLTMSFVKHLKFEEDGILLNGEHATVRKTVQTGDVLSLKTEDTYEDSSILTPCELPLDIVFEDSRIIAPSKPPFMPTHPSYRHRGDTLADAIAFRYAQQNEPFVFRSVNRLDRNTSGLTLIAKDRISASRLSGAMQRGEIKKQYLAVLDGELPLGEGQIEAYIRRISDSIITREACADDKGGDYALTKYTVLCSKNAHSLVLAAPITGRTHQLRVHFASIGAPIAGDDIYGQESELIERHALHALKIRFPHPSNDAPMTLCAPIPDDMQKLISTVFGDVREDLYSLDFGLNS